MMLVVSAVFTQLWGKDNAIQNFPVYLILGQTFFNFLTESTNLAMNSILYAAPLIKKVYMPKYIFPLEKTLFSLVNMAISFIAVVAVLIIYRVPVTITVVCIPLILIYIFFFALGIGLFLSSVAVLFRDIIHLYGVILTAWTYLTPVFYPASILPPKLMTIMNFNPMYHYVTYFRDILWQQKFPSLELNLYCIGFAVLAMLVGVFAFRKNQDKFILYI